MNGPNDISPDMQTPETLHHIATRQLRAQYDERIVNQLTGEPYSIIYEIPAEAGADQLPGAMKYRGVDFYMAESAKPDSPSVMYIQGFGEMPLNKWSTAAEFARNDVTCILPELDRSDMLVNPETGEEDSLYTQAMDLVALFSALRNTEQLRNPDGEPKPTYIVTHSLGFVLLRKMLEQAPDLLRDTRVVALAPAGLRARESYASLLVRWLGMTASEMWPGNKRTYMDEAGVTGKASMATLSFHIPRTVSELKAAVNERVDLAFVAKRVKSLNILPYEKDVLYPPKGFNKAFQRTIAERLPINWMSTISDNTGETRVAGIPNATHDAEERIPDQIVAVALAYLRKTEASQAEQDLIANDDNSQTV